MSKLPLNKITNNIDLGNAEWYSQLDKDDQKQIVPWTTMIWASAVDNPDLTDYYLEIINEYVNKNFSSLSKHPELIWRLLTVVGLGETYRRKWPGSPQGRKVSKVQKFLMDIYPSYSMKDIEMLEQINSLKEIKELAKEHGYSDQEIKKMLG